MLSADVNVLHDPNYPDVSSPNNAAKMNHGVAIAKYTGARGKGGSSDASAEFMAEIRRVFDGAGVAWQMAELGKVDQGGGGTIAMFLARYGMDVVDCGVGVLSMHAPWEVASKLDTYMTYKAYRAFLADAR
jgi:aspartyl aminopeptidase